MQRPDGDITAARAIGSSERTHSALTRILADAGDSTLTFLVGTRDPDMLLHAARRSGFGAALLDGWWDDGYRYHLVAVIGASEEHARRLGGRYRAVPLHVSTRDGHRVISSLQAGGGTTEVATWSDDAVLQAITAAADCGPCVGIAYAEGAARRR